MATFYIEAIENTTITLSKQGDFTAPTAKYGINNTTVPNTYTYGAGISLTAGQKCYWTISGESTGINNSLYLKFTSTGKFNVGGALSDLIGGRSVLTNYYCFFRLFVYCTTLVDASDLVMVSNFGGQAYCYSEMFLGCTSLVAAPELPATDLTEGCYLRMFENCTSLTTVPTLPATVMKYGCYDRMFNGCASLTAAPELPATTLAEQCYYEMFRGCASLTAAPELPATTLGEQCYYGMFYGCTSLSETPELPATTLAKQCYFEMFRGCTSLASAPEIPATDFPYFCCYGMFNGCTGVKLSASRTGDYRTPYRIPESGEGTVGEYALLSMFSNTGGTFVGTPTINTTYYMETPAPSGRVKILYNGEIIAAFDSGTKTLKCADKSMLSNITVEVS